VHKVYQFDRVFGEHASQRQIFEELQVNFLVKKVIEGFNATLFVYGQTGSGKTYTMEGYEYAMAEARNAEGLKIK
jgi:kinesin family protein 11